MRRTGASGDTRGGVLRAHGRGRPVGGGAVTIRSPEPRRRRPHTAAEAAERLQHAPERGEENGGVREDRELTRNTVERAASSEEVEGGCNRVRRRRTSAGGRGQIRPAASFPACVYDGGGRGEHGGAEGLLAGAWRGLELQHGGGFRRLGLGLEGGKQKKKGG